MSKAPLIRKASFVLISLGILCFCFLTCSDNNPADSDDNNTPTITIDTIPPAAISNLRVVGEIDSTCMLTWTAPGDDGLIGLATLYDIRYATDSSILVDWDSAYQVANPPSPIWPGLIQQYQVSGLLPDSEYVFAIKTYDDSGNVSGLSNIAGEISSTPPVINLIEPADGDTVFELVEISAVATDDKGIYKVEFFVDTELVGIAVAPPHTVYWDASDEPNGSQHIIFAVAWDIESNTAVSSAISCVIDTSLGLPMASVLNPASDYTDSSVALIWSKSPDDDFAKYILRVDTSQNQSGIWQNIIVIPDINDTTYTPILEDNWTYRFEVVTEDIYGNVAISNIISATTLNASPRVVNISQIDRIQNASIRLSWQANDNYDFYSYNIYSSDDSTVDTTDTMIASIPLRITTDTAYTPPDSTQEYWFRVFVEDNSGLLTGGNTLSRSARPSAVSVVDTVATDSSITVTWSKSDDPDFSSYEIYIDTVSDFQGNPQSDFILNISDTSYTIFGLNENSDYYFRIRVYDINGYYAESSVLEYGTANLPPAPTTLTAQKINQNTIMLNWVNQNIRDFDRYEIYRSIDSLSVFSNLIASIYDQDSIGFYESNVDSGIVYYYAVRTVDDGGAYSTSNISRISTKYGFALEFDGTDDFGFIPYTMDLLGNPSFTIELWVYWKNNTKYQMVFSRGLDYIEAEFYPGGSYKAHFTSQCTPTYSNVIPDWTWFHLVFEYDHTSNELHSYINGIHYVVNCNIFVPDTTSLFIGMRANNSYYFTGLLDELRIWNYARSETEIQRDYNKVITDAPGLVGYWSFDEGSGQTFDGIGPTGRLGSTTGVDSDDPLWVPSDAPVEY